MKGFILMFLGIVHLHEAFGVTHTLKHFYSASSEVTIFPEFMVVGMVDDVEMVHYDSNIQKAVPKQDWVKQTDAEYWEKERREFIDSQQSFKEEVHVLKEHFNQSGRVHVLQYIYGCSLDNETGQGDGFGQLGYNGENFLEYDTKTLAWKSLKQQADFMRDKWNSDLDRLDFWKLYFSQTCIDCLKKQVVNGKSTLRRRVPPSVFLLQKTTCSPVTCHATGFYPSGVMVFWQKDEQDHHEDVEHGKILPNNDGTFQKSTHLKVKLEEWNNNKYQCVVQVTGIKKDFIKVLTESEIQTNRVTHTLKHFYTASSEVTNFPEFMVVGMVDGVQMVHYDSNIQKAVPKQDWVKQTNAEYWENERREFFDSQQSFKEDVHVLKERFNQSGRVHVLQYIYGCSQDNETGQTDGFGQLGYNGENFLEYDMKTLAWKSLKQQADFLQDKWNSDYDRLAFWKLYFSQTCIDCLKKQVVNGKNTLRRRVPPSVSLLQKTPSSPVTCHATGFYPSGAIVFWQKDGLDHHEDVEHGEILPNNDGTFQKSTHLTVTPEEWNNNKYQCVVHFTGIKDFYKVLTESEIQTNWVDPASFILGGGVALLLVVVVVVIGVVIWKKMSKKVSGFVPASTSDTDSANSGKDAQKI